MSRLLYRIQRSATASVVDFSHPLIEARPVRKRAVILIAADKGLCGALNTNVFRLAAQFDPAITVFITAGRKAAQFVARTQRQLVAEFAYGDSPRFRRRAPSRAFARDLFLSGEVDEVRVVATRFVNTLTQEPVSLEFLPVGEITGDQDPWRPTRRASPAADDGEVVFEPSAEDVLGYLLGHYLNIYIYLRAAEGQGQRAERAHGVDEERDRQRRGADQGPVAGIQQAAARQHHQGTAGDRRGPSPMTPRAQAIQAGTS